MFGENVCCCVGNCLVVVQELLLFNLDVVCCQEFVEIVDCDVVDVWCVVLVIGQLFCYGYLAVEYQCQLDVLLCEVWEGNEGLFVDL